MSIRTDISIGNALAYVERNRGRHIRENLANKLDGSALAPSRILADIQDSRNTNGLLQTLQQTKHEILRSQYREQIGFNDNAHYFESYYDYINRQSDLYTPTPNVEFAQSIHMAHSQLHGNYMNNIYKYSSLHKR